MSESKCVSAQACQELAASLQQPAISSACARTCRRLHCDLVLLRIRSICWRSSWAHRHFLAPGGLLTVSIRAPVIDAAHWNIVGLVLVALCSTGHIG
jgi:hypothetical protein